MICDAWCFGDGAKVVMMVQYAIKNERLVLCKYAILNERKCKNIKPLYSEGWVSGWLATERSYKKRKRKKQVSRIPYRIG